MRTMSKLIILVVLGCFDGSWANLACCNGENVVVDKRCADGSKIAALSCPNKYLLSNSTDVFATVDDHDNLIIEHPRQKSTISPDRYCMTKFNGTDEEVMLVCFDVYEEKVNYIFIPQFMSVFFIILTILIYLTVPDVLDLQGVCILHSISGLAVSFLDLGINQVLEYRPEKTLCMVSAYVIYFASLYAFFWLNTLSFHIWRLIVKPKFLNFPEKNWTYIYHAFGSGGPILMWIILAIAHHSSLLMQTDIHPGLGENKCWFKSTKTVFVYFYGPMSVLISLNMVYYAWTIAVLWKDVSKCNEKHVKVLKYKMMLCVKLFFVMGITWIFEVLSAAFDNTNYAIQILWWITDTFNAMQGTLIFFILVVFRSRVIRGLAQRSFCGFRLPSKWRVLTDDECEEIEEEFGLSETQVTKNP